MHLRLPDRLSMDGLAYRQASPGKRPLVADHCTRGTTHQENLEPALDQPGNVAYHGIFKAT